MAQEKAGTPDHSHIVQQTANEYPWLLERNTPETIQEFMHILGPRMADADPEWGYLTKTMAEKHIYAPDGQAISVDSFIYQPNQQVVDCLTNAADPAYGKAAATWQYKEKRENNNWYPIKEAGDGGGTDTDEEYDQEFEDLWNAINELKNKVAQLEANAVLYETKIALLSSGAPDHPGTILCAESGGPYKVTEQFVLTARDSVGAWESWVVKRGQ